MPKARTVVIVVVGVLGVLTLAGIDRKGVNGKRRFSPKLRLENRLAHFMLIAGNFCALIREMLTGGASERRMARFRARPAR
jgi:hypothetical protein